VNELNIAMCRCCFVNMAREITNVKVRQQKVTDFVISLPGNGAGTVVAPLRLNVLARRRVVAKSKRLTWSFLLVNPDSHPRITRV